MKKLGFIALLLMVPSLALAFGFRYGQASVTVGTAVVVGSKTSRNAITMFNTDATNPVYCGDSAVTSSNGMKVAAGSAFTIDNAPEAFASQPAARADIYCVATGGTVVVTYWEDVQ